MSDSKSKECTLTISLISGASHVMEGCIFDHSIDEIVRMLSEYKTISFPNRGLVIVTANIEAIYIDEKK